jgi:hypothetical protein
MPPEPGRRGGPARDEREKAPHDGAGLEKCGDRPHPRSRQVGDAVRTPPRFIIIPSYPRMQDRLTADELARLLAPLPPPPGAPPVPEAAGQEAPGREEPPRKPRWWSGRQNSRKTPDRPCLNCGDPTVGNYCPTCGQRKVDVRISLRRMLREALDDQLSLNSTLPRTLGAMLFRPGRLTQDYVQGRMARYIPPFRLYLVCSLLFFVALSFVADPRQLSMSQAEEIPGEAALRTRIADSVMLAHARRSGEDTVPLVSAVSKSRSAKTTGSIEFGPDPENVPGFMKPLALRMKETEARLNAMPRREALRTLIEAFEENAPVGVFVMMPLFALILKLVYIRRKRFYVEHFVFALHAHAFAFLVGTAVLMMDSDAVDAAVMVWCLIYLFVALKRVYGQGFFRTFAHYVLLGISYSFLLIFGVTATVLATALSL